MKDSFSTLVLPFLSRSSEIIGKKILFKFDENNFLLNLNVNISSNFSLKEFPSKAKNIEISFLENKDTFQMKIGKIFINFLKNTFVEETDSLKKVQQVLV